MKDTSTITAHHDAERAEIAASAQECFLCTLDPARPCSVPQLEGRILKAYERNVNGKWHPFIQLQTPHFVALLTLTDYYRNFVKDLNTRGSAIKELTLRVYHLPTAARIIEREGEKIHHYIASPYTLAVLEPDVLLNITDLAQAQYCSRQYLLNRLVPAPASAATIRGNLVHYCFKELLKEHDRGSLMPRNEHNSLETPLAVLHHYLEQGLQQYKIELALANVPVEEMYADIASHLEALATWYQNQSATLWDMPTAYATEETSEDPSERNQVRAETFLLAPEIGLRGRLDLFWQQAGRQRLLELKTGGSSGDLPKPDHRRQVQGYHAQLLVRRNSTMKKALATLVYSGTPGEAQAYGIDFTLRELQRVNETRNILVLSHTTGIPSAPPGPSRCTKCAMLIHCERISSFLDWSAPQPEGREQNSSGPASNALATPSARRTYVAEDREFFVKYYRLLQIEGRESEQQLAFLWKETVEQRARRGVVIHDLQLLKTQQTPQGEWWQTFACENKSELRKGDEILLSDGDPITGQVVTGTVVEIGAQRVTVWTPELIINPVLIDRYDNDLVHVRTLQNLMRWLEQTEPHMRDLVAHRVRPRFIGINVPPRPDFNAEQNLAVERALQMQDYLLIQGPPGTGKTSVIAEIVKQLVQQGQRVLLAAFTNQAVDNVLKRLSNKEHFHNFVRLGHERSIDESSVIQQRLLQNLLKSVPGNTGTGMTEDDVHAILSNMPVVASTTATWSSDKYSPGFGFQNDSTAMLQFDVAIVDEASQLTLPALLGALRFAKRFILVGDDKQLPPLVLSQEAATREELAKSLFSTLKQQNENYMKSHEMEISACVSLNTQYRMNRWISHFSSKVFYEERLMPHESVAHKRLELTPPRNESSTMSGSAAIRRVIDPTRPLAFLDVRDTQDIDSLRDSNQAKTRDVEARAVRDIVAALLAHGIKEAEIGVIAPYRAQVANIRHHLFGSSPENGWTGLAGDSLLTVDTVDRFQGGERLVIIMSFATSVEPEINSQRREFLTNPNRLNVALTRAQRKLILVGCVPALERLPYFERLITYCRSMKTIIQLE